MMGIIGGSGVYEITEIADNIEEKIVSTKYGDVKLSILDIEDKKVVFLPRHSSNHSIPPHKINFKGNIMALKQIGVNQIIATSSVGSLSNELAPGTFILPDDFLDFTVLRDRTFYNDEVVHMDFSSPYCSRLRKIIASFGTENNPVINGGTYVCAEGPRFETGAEIKMFQMVGGDVVGMTGLPELVFAREKEMCYATICLVSNYATSISKTKLTFDEVAEIMNKKKEVLLDLILNTIKSLEDDFDCECLHALDD